MFVMELKINLTVPKSRVLEQHSVGWAWKAVDSPKRKLSHDLAVSSGASQQYSAADFFKNVKKKKKKKNYVEKIWSPCVHWTQ